jgi:hypothetical protein
MPSAAAYRRKAQVFLQLSRDAREEQASELLAMLAAENLKRAEELEQRQVREPVTSA